jgi:hypothetical protein
MASRYSVARAARQFASVVARRPSPFMCQRWTQATQSQRLFSVSAARMSASGAGRAVVAGKANRRGSQGEEVHRGPRVD